MADSLKEELHQLINNCDNGLLLGEVKTLLQGQPVKDWWDELTDDDKDSIVQPGKQHEGGA